MMQENHLSLSGCMQRHLIYLAHEQKNLLITKEICEKLGRQEENLHALNVSAYLSEMELLEKGGTRFMDIGKKDRRKKKKRVAYRRPRHDFSDA